MLIAMASDVVEKVLADVLTDDRWSTETEQAVLIKESALYIINKAGGEDVTGLISLPKI